MLAMDLYDLVKQTFTITHDISSSADVDTSPSKRFNQDPFADLRQKNATSPSTSLSTKRAWTVEFDRQLQIYENVQLGSDYDSNPFSYWKN
ncbi:unnamed protein product [Adineta ricciae]|uniref:Uncharacterized protein n=1 Tax=Adineta ricciae TaxID=249248 RepID=A0A815VNH8_ADIRI|nr:unnamed protein product [Adineta ricciae]CAF1631406.1 unnamed protein product [Adineta ricciae]